MRDRGFDDPGLPANKLLAQQRFDLGARARGDFEQSDGASESGGGVVGQRPNSGIAPARTRRGHRPRPNNA